MGASAPWPVRAALALGAALPLPVLAQAAAPAGAAADTAWQRAGLALVVVLGAALLVIALWRLATLWRERRRAGTTAYAGIEHGTWPELTVFITACHDASAVSGCIQSVLNSDYPSQRVRIVPVSEPYEERTRAVIDAYAHLFPDRIQPYHRDAVAPDKGAALQEALAVARGDIAIVLDATYVPSPGLLKQLALPFFDPEVGAVMGRVVQVQAADGLLSRVLGRLLRDELLAGQPQPRQASMYLRAVPDGSSVGGVRLSAVVAVGGWNDSAFASHTDITVRLLSNGWKTVYNHRAECQRAAPTPRASGASPAARAYGGGGGRLVASESPRRQPMTVDRRVPPLRLRPMPSLHSGPAQVWRQVFTWPLLLALAGALGLHLMGADWLLSGALPMTALVLLGARAGWPAMRKR